MVAGWAEPTIESVPSCLIVVVMVPSTAVVNLFVLLGINHRSFECLAKFVD